MIQFYHNAPHHQLNICQAFSSDVYCIFLLHTKSFIFLISHLLLSTLHLFQIVLKICSADSDFLSKHYYLNYSCFCTKQFLKLMDCCALSSLNVDVFTLCDWQLGVTKYMNLFSITIVIQIKAHILSSTVEKKILDLLSHCTFYQSSIQWRLETAKYPRTGFR